MTDKGENPDIAKLRAVLGILGDELGKMAEHFSQMMSNPKWVESYAKAPAEFYKQMRAAGMSDEKAAELTAKFLERMNPLGPLGGLFGGAGGGFPGKGFGDLFGGFGKPPRDEDTGSKDKKSSSR